MSALIRILAFAALLVQPALAVMPRYEEHLLPEDSVYTDIRTRVADEYFYLYEDYEDNVTRVLIDAFNDDVIARVIVYPSFEPEYVVALKIADGDYSILHLKSSVQLFNFEALEMLRAGAYRVKDDPDGSRLAAQISELEGQLPASRQDVAVERCEREISKELGVKLYSLWSEMLFRTRYPDLRPANPDTKPVLLGTHIDGTAYHFSFEYPGFTLAGTIHSPSEESNTGKFVAIAEMMKDACNAEDQQGTVTVMIKRVDELTAALSETVY